MFDMDDTIAALSSAAGQAGRAIVRLSGPEAIGLAGRVFDGPLAGLGGFRCADGRVRVQGHWGEIATPARVYLFRAPRSYTRQDVVELHLPGQVVAAAVLSALLAEGARQAQAGEFTARAFLSGRLDLARSQAVADVIDAQADAQLRSAVGVMEGALARLCQPAAEKLTEALALAEASIDFADEHLELASPAHLAGILTTAADELDHALASTGRWPPAGGQPRVAIAGKPNAGKSSLLNALSGLDRAIVSALAGTTRDVLSAPARLGDGLEVLLLDAAGLDNSDDPLARAAQSAARDAVRSAEGVLFVFDLADGELAPQADLLAEVCELNSRCRPVVIANKVDLLDNPAGRLAEVRVAWSRCFSRDHDCHAVGSEHGHANSSVAMPPAGEHNAWLQTAQPRHPVIPVSAARGTGLDDLRRQLAEQLADLAAPQAGGLLLHENQRRAIAQAGAAARAAGKMAEASAEIADRAELLAVEIRAALDHLSELTGAIAGEDVLGEIFARFCVGK